MHLMHIRLWGKKKTEGLLRRAHKVAAAIRRHFRRFNDSSEPWHTQPFRREGVRLLSKRGIIALCFLLAAKEEKNNAQRLLAREVAIVMQNASGNRRPDALLVLYAQMKGTFNVSQFESEKKNKPNKRAQNSFELRR